MQVPTGQLVLLLLLTFALGAMFGAWRYHRVLEKRSLKAWRKVRANMPRAVQDN
jgi:hypothetical protein